MRWERLRYIYELCPLMPVRRERGLMRPMYAPGPGPSSIRNWSAPHIDAAAWEAKRDGRGEGVGGRRDGETRRKRVEEVIVEWSCWDGRRGACAHARAEESV